MRLTYVIALIVLPVLAACTASIDLEEPFVKIDITPKSVDWFQLALDSMVEVRSYLRRTETERHITHEGLNVDDVARGFEETARSGTRPAMFAYFSDGWQKYRGALIEEMVRSIPETSTVHDAYSQRRYELDSLITSTLAARNRMITTRTWRASVWNNRDEFFRRHYYGSLAIVNPSHHFNIEMGGNTEWMSEAVLRRSIERIKIVKEARAAARRRAQSVAERKARSWRWLRVGRN